MEKDEPKMRMNNPNNFGAKMFSQFQQQSGEVPSFLFLAYILERRVFSFQSLNESSPFFPQVRFYLIDPDKSEKAGTKAQIRKDKRTNEPPKSNRA